MQDQRLYREIPGLKSSWSVSKVTLNLEQQQVDVFVEHARARSFVHHDPLPSPTLTFEKDRYCREAATQLARDGVWFTDQTMLFQDISETLYVDPWCHFNADGNRMLCDAIVTELMNRAAE